MFTGTAARVVYALLAAVVTYVLLYIIAVVVGKFDVEIKDVIIKFAAIIALLVGLYYLFVGYKLWPKRP